jgi:hypothetical protein
MSLSTDKRAQAISIGATTVATITVLYIAWKVFKGFRGGSSYTVAVTA